MNTVILVACMMLFCKKLALCLCKLKLTVLNVTKNVSTGCSYNYYSCTYYRKVMGYFQSHQQIVASLCENTPYLNSDLCSMIEEMLGHSSEE